MFSCLTIMLPVYATMYWYYNNYNICPAEPMIGMIMHEMHDIMLRWLWGAVAQWSEHIQLKQEALGSIPGGYPGFFLFQLAQLN